MAHPDPEVRRLAAMLGGLTRGMNPDENLRLDICRQLKFARLSYEIRISLESSPPFTDDEIRELVIQISSGAIHSPLFVDKA